MRYLGKRLLLAIPTIWGVCTLVFFFVHLIPGDPVEVMLGETAQAADREELRRQLGLDEPIVIQYFNFLAGLPSLDLGQSFFYKEPVRAMVLGALGPTVELALASLLVALLIALPSGILAASRQGSVLDQASMTISLLGVSMPVFWMGPLLILAFAIYIPIFPPSGRGEMLSIVLPAVTLGVHLAAMLSRMTRSSVLEVIGEDYVTAARARGLPESLVLIKHVMRNAAIPILTVIGMQLGALLSGAVITENVFAWPGLGTEFISALNRRDYPMVQGCVLVFALVYVGVNLLTDIAYAVVDPRIRLDAGGNGE